MFMLITIQTFITWYALIYLPELDVDKIIETNTFFISGNILPHLPRVGGDGFNLETINFRYLSSNIPYSPAYGIYTSQLIRYSRARSCFTDCAIRHQCLNELSNNVLLYSQIHSDFV